MNDPIERQAAIDLMLAALDDDWEPDYAKDRMCELPSAQPKPDENTLSEQQESDKLGVKTGETCTDCISRQAAIDMFQNLAYDDWNQGVSTSWADAYRECAEMIRELPSAQPEPLKDKEQRIFLAAMTREEKVCKEVDAEMSGEQYEEILVRVCREIVRKVKGALWT